MIEVTMLIFRLKFFLISFLILNLKIIAQERYNYAEVWNGWNNNTRYVYLWGFLDGGDATYGIAGEYWLNEGDWFKEPELPKVKIVREKTHLFFELEVIREVITELYKDPANSYISFTKIVYISRDKIKGDDIEESIRLARKEANENYLMMQKRK